MIPRLYGKVILSTPSGNDVKLTTLQVFSTSNYKLRGGKDQYTSDNRWGAFDRSRLVTDISRDEIVIPYNRGVYNNWSRGYTLFMERNGLIYAIVLIDFDSQLRSAKCYTRYRGISGVTSSYTVESTNEMYEI